MLLENVNVKPAFAPVDLNTAAVTGARVSLADAEKVTFILNLGVSLTGAAVIATLRQHDAASAGNSKDLSVAHKYFHKIAGATSFTEVVPGSAAAAKNASAIFDTAAGILVLEVNASDLDHSNGYTYFSVDLADGAVAKIGSGLYVLSECGRKPAHAEAV